MRSTRSHTPQEVWDRPFVQEHQEWCDDFVVELRLRDVPGTVIGDHLAEVETHCGESGETPREAFGEPVEYARHLAEESGPEPVTGVWTVVLLSVGQLVGLLVGTSAAWSWARGEELSYNLAQIGAVALLTAVVLVVPAVLRPLVRRPWAVGTPLLLLTSVAGAGTAFGGRLDLPGVLTLPPAAVTVALFAVVVVLAALEYRELADDDRVTSPLAPPSPEPATPSGRASLLPTVLMPAAYVLFSVLALVAG
ncbi:MAG TPA: hypothetical protein VKZ83_12315 [Phototrophicaceae bacterium]|nr:hypothetical protein [Phototrophicaceae bacterium]